MSIPNTDDSLFTRWWSSIDRVLLASILVLIGSGLVLSLAASPAMAIKRGLPVFYYAQRHIMFAGLAVLIMLGFSMLGPRLARRVSLLLLTLAFAMLMAVLWVGPEINGARRWLRLAGYSFQPSELAKPVFVVVSAWLFAESRRRPAMPAIPLAIALYATLVGLLVLQPDIGQTLLVTLVWGAMFFIAGMPLAWAAGFAGLGLAGLAGAYASFGHVRDRIDRFLNPATGDNYQMERALQAIREGGLLGRGPGEGTVKTVLPDAHTDFIFAVIAEEYGALTCLALVGLVAFIAVRAFARALDAEDAFQRNAVVGLTLLFVLQAAINMAVNTGLMPAKGMTLPFVSYGGSSMLALAVSMGLLIGLARLPRTVPGPRDVTGVATSGHSERSVW